MRVTIRFNERGTWFWGDRWVVDYNNRQVSCASTARAARRRARRYIKRCRKAAESVEEVTG